jgi:hypothetical protein
MRNGIGGELRDDVCGRLGHQRVSEERGDGMPRHAHHAGKRGQRDGVVAHWSPVGPVEQLCTEDGSVQSLRLCTGGVKLAAETPSESR